MASIQAVPTDGSSGAEDARLGLGRAGEEAAVRHYRRLGYRVLDRNWRCPLGELDLVLTRGSLVVFCEVKSRRGSALGGPHDAVTWRKQRKLRALAEAYLSAGRRVPQSIRFDVASVLVVAPGSPSVFVFEDAF